MPSSLINVSVLVPIYNSERYLCRCLRSLELQTLDKIEFICINDGSCDSSLKIIKSFIDRDDRFKLINKTNSGYGASMNAGLRVAKGEYIGIVESDDYADPNMFEALFKLSKKYSTEIVCSNRYDLTESSDEFNEVMKGVRYGQVFSPIDFQEIFMYAPCIWSKIYKRYFLEENGIHFLETPGASLQDTSFVYNSLFATDKIIATKEAFLHYRTDNLNKSVKSSKNYLSILDEFGAIDAFISKYPDKMMKFTSYSDLRIQAYLWNYNRLNKIAKLKFRNKMKFDLIAAAAHNYFRLSDLSPEFKCRLQKLYPHSFLS